MGSVKSAAIGGGLLLAVSVAWWLKGSSPVHPASVALTGTCDSVYSGYPPVLTADGWLLEDGRGNVLELDQNGEERARRAGAVPVSGGSVDVTPLREAEAHAACRDGVAVLTNERVVLLRDDVELWSAKVQPQAQNVSCTGDSVWVWEDGAGVLLRSGEVVKRVELQWLYGSYGACQAYARPDNTVVLDNAVTGAVSELVKMPSYLSLHGRVEIPDRVFPFKGAALVYQDVHVWTFNHSIDCELPD